MIILLNSNVDSSMLGHGRVVMQERNSEEANRWINLRSEDVPWRKPEQQKSNKEFLTFMKDLSNEVKWR